MFPHPDTVYEVRAQQNRELLAEAAKERLAKEATRNVPPPSWIGSGRDSASHILAWLSAVTSTAPRSRRPPLLTGLGAVVTDLGQALDEAGQFLSIVAARRMFLS